MRQVKLTNNYQAMSKIPLMLAMDAEWGPAMRLDSVISFQRQLTWGAMSDDSTVYEVGEQIAQQLKRLALNAIFPRVITVNIIRHIRFMASGSFGQINYKDTLTD